MWNLIIQLYTWVALLITPCDVNDNIIKYIYEIKCSTNFYEHELLNVFLKKTSNFISIPLAIIFDLANLKWCNEKIFKNLFNNFWKK